MPSAPHYLTEEHGTLAACGVCGRVTLLLCFTPRERCELKYCRIGQRMVAGKRQTPDGGDFADVGDWTTHPACSGGGCVAVGFPLDQSNENTKPKGLRGTVGQFDWTNSIQQLA